MIEPSAIDLVIYHKDCTDGFGAAYSAWKLLGSKAQYHAAKHGDAPPDVFDKTVAIDRKSTRLNSSHAVISYAVFSFNK